MRIEDVYIAGHIKYSENIKDNKSKDSRKRDTVRERIVEIISSITNRLHDK